LLASGFNVTTFGEDEAGEMYVANAANGTVHHIEGSRAPRFSASGVVNAASFVAGIVPGSLATVFVAGVRDDAGDVIAEAVPLPTTVAGVSVTVAGTAAPVYSVANIDGRERVTFQVPSLLAGQKTAAVIVTRDGQASKAVDVPVAEFQPGVFTIDGTQAVIVHGADLTLATAERPLGRGEVAALYASGLGAVLNTPVDGAAGPVSPLATALAQVGVTIGGTSCDVLYAGLAPGFVGVYEVNFRVPAEAPSGVQDIVLSANAAAAPPVRVVVQ
jgi:uncharacterized protein (TIGR03437 family)